MITAETLETQHQEIEQEIFNNSLRLLVPFYARRREFARSEPRFWARAMEKSELFGEDFTFQDTEILDFLEDFDVTWQSDTKKYEIVWVFADNPYLEACTLRKTFDQSSMTSNCVEVPWKKGQDLTKNEEIDPTFFRWFAKQDESAFELASALSEDFFPHALRFYKYDGDVVEEFDVSDSDGE